jgi:hypothetical protein
MSAELIEELPERQVPAAVQFEPVRMMFSPQSGGVGVTPDGQKFCRFQQFPFEVTVVLTEELRHTYVTGLTGGIVLP